MRQIPKFRKGTQITSEQLNSIVDIVNELSGVYSRVAAQLEALNTSHQEISKEITQFLSEYRQTLKDTPDIIKLLQDFNTAKTLHFVDLTADAEIVEEEEE